ILVLQSRHFRPPFLALIRRLAVARALTHHAFVRAPAPHARRLLAAGTNEQHVGRRGGARTLDHAALRVGAGGPHVALLDIDALHHDSVLPRPGLQDFALLSFVLAADDGH